VSKYRTQSTYVCPYCHLVGWRKTGDVRAHIKKSHPDKDADYTVKNWFKLFKERHAQSERNRPWKKRPQWELDRIPKKD